MMQLDQIEDGSLDAGLMMLEMIDLPYERVWTAREIAAVCGVPRHHIEYLERSGLKKLRKALEQRGVTPGRY